MANLHLVTGHAGEPHVKSTDDASLMQAIYGGDSVVLDRNNAFSYDVISNNIIRIYDGEALMQGRYIKMDKGNYVDLNIDNGHTGYRRIDVIAIEYTKDDETNIEEANLVVVKGSETQQEEANVPQLIVGDTVDGSASTNQMALYHVKIDGLSIIEVTQVYAVGQDFQTIASGQINTIGAVTHGLVNVAKKSLDVFKQLTYEDDADVQTRIDLENLVNGLDDTGSYVFDPTQNVDERLASLTNLVNSNTRNIVDANANISKNTVSIAELLGFPGIDDIVGLQVDLVNNEFTRLGMAKGLEQGADFDKFGPFKRRRCNVADDGTINAFYGDDGYVEDGSNGQVMVYQPKFYYRVTPIQIDKQNVGTGYDIRKANYYVSETHHEGFKIHPGFINENGDEVDYILISAYEGSLFDTSADVHILNDAQVADFNADKLSSIANAKPISGLSQNLTRANARKLASNLGLGWSLSTIKGLSITQMLFLIEYATFNMQTALGAGVTNKQWDGTNNSEITGATVNLGNSSGSVTNANGYNVVSYRGEENPFGNIWKWLDGMNEYIHWDETDPDNKFVNQYDMYINLDGNYTDDTGTGYNKLSFSPATTNGYVSAFGYEPDYDFLFIPAKTEGNSSLPVGDHYYRSDSTGWRVAMFGGGWATGASAGGFYLDLGAASGSRRATVGARLEYVPQSN